MHFIITLADTNDLKTTKKPFQGYQLMRFVLRCLILLRNYHVHVKPTIYLVSTPKCFFFFVFCFFSCLSPKRERFYFLIAVNFLHFALIIYIFYTFGSSRGSSCFRFVLGLLLLKFLFFIFTLGFRFRQFFSQFCLESQRRNFVPFNEIKIYRKTGE